jgi:hypothetical protein
MEKLKSRLGSWKFWITILVSGLSAGLFATGHIDVDRMIDVIRVATGIYVGSLGFEDGFKKIAPVLSSILNEQTK